MTLFRASAVLIGALLVVTTGDAQERYPSNFTPSLAERPAVRDALGWLEQNFPAQVEEWIHITGIPAKSGHEAERAAYVRAQMEREGLTVSIDSIGNVVGRRPGTGGGPTVVFAAHLDTVYPLGTDLTVRVAGDTLHAPGIFDNSASVANMLAIIRALNQARIQTEGDLIFIGTTFEEEGLRGMAYWLDSNPGLADVLVAMDGGVGSVNYGALGFYWSRYFFRGEGSHTVSSTGKPHPVRALARAVQSIYELRIPEGRGGAVFNIGMIDGGEIFNGIPQEVSFTMDLRSVNPVLLDSLNMEIEQRVARAAELERVEWAMEEVVRNQAAGTPEMLEDRRRHPLIQTALDIHEYLGLPSRASPSGSTDANMGVVRGIPTISVGRSFGGDQHTLTEWAHVPSALPSTKMVLLIALAMAGLP